MIFLKVSVRDVNAITIPTLDHPLDFPLSFSSTDYISHTLCIYFIYNLFHGKLVFDYIYINLKSKKYPYHITETYLFI